MAKGKVTGNKQKVTSNSAKKEGLRLKSPQIFRKITAEALWRWLIALIIVSFLLLQVVQLAKTLYQNYYDAQLKQAEKQQLENEVNRWRQIVSLRPDYRDAYFELAVLAYRLNHIEESKQYLAKVFELDPNYQPARELEKALNK